MSGDRSALLGWSIGKAVTTGGCPDCMVAFNTPGKAPGLTGPPKL